MTSYADNAEWISASTGGQRRLTWLLPSPSRCQFHRRHPRETDGSHCKLLCIIDKLACAVTPSITESARFVSISDNSCGCPVFLEFIMHLGLELHMHVILFGLTGIGQNILKRSCG